jgi:hypothetical protein
MPKINVKANEVSEAPEVGVTPYKQPVLNGKANLTWNAIGNLNPKFPDSNYFAWTNTGSEKPAVPARTDETTLTLDYDNTQASLWTYRVRILYDGGPTRGIWIDPEIDNRPPGG